MTDEGANVGINMIDVKSEQIITIGDSNKITQPASKKKTFQLI